MRHDGLIDRPIFIIGCNRSGTTLLFRNLSEHPETWSLYEESQHVFYRHYPIDDSWGDRIAEPATPEVAKQIRKDLYHEAHNKEILVDRALLRHIPRKFLQRQLNPLYKRPPLRLVEKTPANCFRIPMLADLFPDGRFIFLMRRAEDVISSLMEGWKFWSRTENGEWRYGEWHYLVPPGWQGWTGRSLAEICAFQWIESNQTAWEDLNHYCADRLMLVYHEDAIRAPMETYHKILEFCQLPRSQFFEKQLGRLQDRVFTHFGSSPRAGKWKELHGEEVESVRPLFQPLMDHFYTEKRGAGGLYA